METHLWVGSLVFEPEGHGSGLRRFTVHDTTLRPSLELDLANPAWLDIRDGRLWAGLHLADSALVGIDLDSGGLLGEPVHTGDADACHLALSPTGDWVALAHYTSGSVSIFGTGSEGGGPRLVEHRRFGGHSGIVPTRQEAPHAHHVEWLSDQMLLVCDLGADVVRCLSWDEVALTEVEPIVLPPGFGPRHLVQRSSGVLRQIAVVGELSGQVATFETARHDLVGWRRTGLVDATRIGGTAPSGIRAVSQDTLVVANRMVNTLAFLHWANDGTLVLLDEVDSGGDHPRDLVVHEGRIWVAHQNSGDVTVHAETSHGWRIVDRTEVPSPAALSFHLVGHPDEGETTG